MKYFLIAGEASGDLHASQLMAALRREDSEASFRFYGGDLMSAVGGTRLCHYRDLAYMGFLPVLLHLPQILSGLERCKQAIKAWKPDAVILIDYPGFNLRVARYVHRLGLCPVFYYISPKIWAWKEQRIKSIRENVDRLFSILPFETDYYEKRHGYRVSYVGNPTVDEIAAFRASCHEDKAAFCRKNGLDPQKKTLALLPGSRQTEIKRNLAVMCAGAFGATDNSWQLVIGQLSSLPQACYAKALAALPERVRTRLKTVTDATYPLLSHAEAAVVTSGTAVLEAVAFRVPTVACYATLFGGFVRRIKPFFLKIPYVTLPNLIAGREVVEELVGDEASAQRIEASLSRILPGAPQHAQCLAAYEDVMLRLGPPGAPERAAREMAARLRGEQGEA